MVDQIEASLKIIDAEIARDTLTPQASTRSVKDSFAEFVV